MKPSVYHFYVKTNITLDFNTCVSVPLRASYSYQFRIIDINSDARSSIFKFLIKSVIHKMYDKSKSKNIIEVKLWPKTGHSKRNMMAPGKPGSDLITVYLFFLFIHSLNVGKLRYAILVYHKNSFPYKNKMLIKTNRAIKSITNKSDKTNKLNFKTKKMNKTNF